MVLPRRAGLAREQPRVSQARQRQRDDDDEAEPPVSSERRSHDDLSVYEESDEVSRVRAAASVYELSN